jgi:hypothetical protein
MIDDDDDDDDRNNMNISCVSRIWQHRLLEVSVEVFHWRWLIN